MEAGPGGATGTKIGTSPALDIDAGGIPPLEPVARKLVRNQPNAQHLPTGGAASLTGRARYGCSIRLDLEKPVQKMRTVQDTIRCGRHSFTDA